MPTPATRQTTCRSSPRSRSGRRPGDRRASALEAIPQLLDLIGKLGFTRAGSIDDRGRSSRHERLVREPLARSLEPALDFGEVADEPIAFEGACVAVGRLGPDGGLDLATLDEDRQIARPNGGVERLGCQLAM